MRAVCVARSPAVAALTIVLSCFQAPKYTGLYRCSPEGSCFGGFICDDGVCCNPEGEPACPSLLAEGRTCAGGAEPLVYFDDMDRDGFGAHLRLFCALPLIDSVVTVAGDCNDDSEQGGRSVYPGAAEGCDGIDNNCNGEIDEGATRRLYFFDKDGDGFGADGTGIAACSAPPAPPGGGRYVVPAGDCDDTRTDVYPGASELCDGIDNDCSTIADDFYEDRDGDGYGDPSRLALDCRPGHGAVNNNLDCNDDEASLHPGTVWYQDVDNDGLGNPNVTVTQCSRPKTGQNEARYVNNAGDCDDLDPKASFYKPWWPDPDGDGYGSLDAGSVQYACTPPLAYADNSEDCDPRSEMIHPSDLDGGKEVLDVCDHVDNDCDGSIDEQPDCGGPWDVFDPKLGLTIGALDLGIQFQDNAFISCKRNWPGATPDVFDPVRRTWSGRGNTSHIFFVETSRSWDVSDLPGAVNPNLMVRLMANYGMSNNQFHQPVIFLCGADGNYERYRHNCGPGTNPMSTAAPDAGLVDIWVNIGESCVSPNYWNASIPFISRREIVRMEILVQPDPAPNDSFSVRFVELGIR